MAKRPLLVVLGLVLYWSNHDQPRAVSWFGNKAPEFRDLSAKMLAALLHFMQGTPYIYQGEEIGMTNDYLEKIEDYEDIESLTSYYQRTEGMGEDPEYMFNACRRRVEIMRELRCSGMIVSMQGLVMQDVGLQLTLIIRLSM